MGHHVRGVLVLIGLLCLGLSTPVAAQSKSEAAEAFAAGAKLYKEANYMGAIAAFERAYRLHPHFLISCNIARCHERRSDMVKAAEFYTRCLKEGGDKSRKAAKIRKALQSVESQIAWVTITSRHRTGKAFVNGKPVGQTPVTVPLNSGTFRLEVRRELATPARMTIEAGIGEKRTVVLIPKAIVTRRTTKTGEDDVLGDDDEEREGLSQVWFWTTAAAALGFAIAGTVMGVQTLDANNSYNDDPLEETYNKVIDRRLATNVLWGLAIGAAAASTVLFFYTDFSRSSSRKTDKQSSAGPSTFVFGVRGRF
jgi:hypothetical protein